MLRPADIADRDFLVVVHGYHKGEVHDFLAQVAGAYADLLDQVQQQDVDTGRDDFESMGVEIASVLRAAKEAAAAMTADADAKLAEADALLAEARRETDELRANAQTALAEAREDAARLQHEAEERANQIRREAEEHAHAHRIEAEAGVRARLDVLGQHEQVIRSHVERLGDAVREATGSFDGPGAVDLDLEAASLQ
jgi:DivIVA domain-containing protein